MQLEAFRPGRALILYILTKLRKRHTFEMIEIIADERFARRNRDLFAGANRQHSMTHGAEALGAVALTPSNDADRQSRQEVGMASENPETSGRVFGAHGHDICRSATMVVGVVTSSLIAAPPRWKAFCFSRASSSVPTI